VLTLVVLPLFAVPSYFLGQVIADSFDDDPTNGVAAPALLSIFLARVWGEFRWIATLALGVGSGLVSLVVLFTAFVAFCTATTGIV
jgi:hypothetical protein